MIQITAYFIVFLLMLGRTVAQSSRVCAMVPDGSYVRSSVSCKFYNQCSNGVDLHFVCPEGSVFNASSQSCESNVGVDCSLCSPFGIQNIPHPDSCNKFYRCINGSRLTMTCPDGLLFDRYFGECNLASVVFCEPRSN